jgi:hypothetical protein
MTERPERPGLCVCGRALDLRHIDPKVPVRCPGCGRESYGWQLAVRANRHEPAPAPVLIDWETAR